MTFQDNKSYKISVAASDLRDKEQHRECSLAVIVDTSKPTHGWVHDGAAEDLDYQSSKLFQVNWGGFQTRNGVDKYEWKVLLTSYGSSQNTELTIFSNTNLNTRMNITISNVTDGSKVQFVVRAYTKAGLYREVKSNGIIFDNTPPIAGKVFAGTKNTSDVKYATWRKKFFANWNPFSDPQTTIWRYTCAIKKQGDLFSTAYRDNALNRTATFGELNLVSGEKYCVVVRGYNMAGLYTEATSDCVLIDYDAPRAGTVNDGSFADIDYQSNNTVLAANWNGFTDGNRGSGIIEYKYKITQENGVTILNWTSAGNTTNIIVSGQSLEGDSKYFVTVSAIDVVGLSASATSDGVLVDNSLPLKGQVYDGSDPGSDMKYASWNDTFSANWEPFIDAQSPLLKYSWAVQLLNGSYVSSFSSTGFSHSATARDLHLVSGERYCAVVKGYNQAGLFSEATSDCLLIDHDPPQAGTVNDGYADDSDYQSDSTSITANWNGFTDGIKGSGIVKYEYKVSNANGNIVVPWKNVGNANNITTSCLSLISNTIYFVTIKAIDAAGLSSSATSDGVLVDTSPPRAGKIYDGGHLGSDSKYETWNDTFSANWDPFIDPQSLILKYDWAVKEMNNRYITSFFKIGLNTIANVTRLKLFSGQRYCAVVRGYNRAGLYTEAASNCVLIDRNVPQAGTVNDGSLSDVDYQSNDTSISANWYGFTDGKNGSGIVGYKYKVVDENGSIFLDWTSVGNATSFSKGGLLLRNNIRYFVTVNATDAVGLSTTASSDGFLVDISHPITAKIYDGSQTGSDVKYASWINTFSANWEPFLDEQSFILKYTWAVYHLNVGFITQFISTGLNCSGTANNLKLISGEKYCAVVRGYNKAMLYSERSSDCVLIDRDAPQAGAVNDGGSRDVSYQVDSTMIAANWHGFTDGTKGSGIVEYKYKITDSCGTAIVPWTSSNTAKSIIHTGLSLTMAEKYSVSVMAIDAVGLTAVAASNGVIVAVGKKSNLCLFEHLNGAREVVKRDKSKSQYLFFHNPYML